MQRDIEEIHRQCERYDIAHDTAFRNFWKRVDFYTHFNVRTAADLVGMSEASIRCYSRMDTPAKNWVLWMRQNLVENGAWQPGEVPAPRPAGAPASRIEQSPLARAYHERGARIRELEALVNDLQTELRSALNDIHELKAQACKRRREESLVDAVAGLVDYSLEEVSLENLYEAAERASVLARRLATAFDTRRAEGLRRVAAEKLRVARLKAQRAAADEKAPDAFKCPITAFLMEDPVMNRAGHTYERKAIERWFVHHNTDPKTNAELASKELTPNHALRALIVDLVSQQ
jgi:hypothetical protein